MGVDSQEHLAKQLGHGTVQKYDISINSGTRANVSKPGAAPAARPSTAEQMLAQAGAAAAPAAPAPKKDIHAEFAKKEKLKKMLAMAEEGLNSRFSDMFKAFQYVDLDRSGRLSRDEIRRALDMWNVPLDDEMLDELLGDCDQDGDGGVSYEEFVDKLARGTVAPAAMGKRGLQSKEAMGVDSQEHLAKQLGHGTVKKYNISINA